MITFGVIGNGDCKESKVNLKDLSGIWKQDIPVDFALVLRISTDGTFRIAYAVDKLDTRPTDRGQIKVEGKQVTFISAGSPTCKNHIGNYDIKITEKGNFQLTEQKDPCGDRQRAFIPEWTRVKE